MARHGRKKPSPQQLSLFDASPLPSAASILPFYLGSQYLDVPAVHLAKATSEAAAAVRHADSVGSPAAGSAFTSFSPASKSAPATATDAAGDGARRGRRPSSISIRRNRSKYAPVAPSLDFLCGTDDTSEANHNNPAAGGIIQAQDDPENDDGESSSSSCCVPGYTALASLSSSAAATLEAAGESPLAAAGRLANEMTHMTPAKRVLEERRLYDRSGEYDDEDGDGLRLMLTPEQLARIEEVQASWTKRQKKKRKVQEERPLMVTEIEADGIEAGNRKRRSVDDGGDGR